MRKPNAKTAAEGDVVVLTADELADLRSIEQTIAVRVRQLGELSFQVLSLQEKMAAIARAIDSDRARLTERSERAAAAHGLRLDGEARYALDLSREPIGFRRQ